MSAFDLMRQFSPDLTDEEIWNLLAAAERRRLAEADRHARRVWRRFGARASTAPWLSRMRSSYRRRRR
jgi:hypothetical protein